MILSYKLDRVMDGGRLRRPPLINYRFYVKKIIKIYRKTYKTCKKIHKNIKTYIKKVGPGPDASLKTYEADVQIYKGVVHAHSVIMAHTGTHSSRLSPHRGGTNPADLGEHPLGPPGDTLGGSKSSKWS